MYSKLPYATIQLKFINIKFIFPERSMISEDLLNVIACPETKQDLVIAEDELVDRINSLIEGGELLDRAKQQITEKIDGGLLPKEDQKYLYPIRNEIPILLMDESIPLDNLK